MARKAKIRLPIFLITLLIGISLVAIALLQPEVIFADTTRPLDISGLSLIAVPIDPTGGQILGTVFLTFIQVNGKFLLVELVVEIEMLKFLGMVGMG